MFIFRRSVLLTIVAVILVFLAIYLLLKNNSKQLFLNYRLVNTSGEILTKSKFKKIGYYSNGLASAKLNNKFGFIDMNGKVVIDYIYDLAMPYRDELALISQNDKLGFIDVEGDLIIPVIYEEATAFINGLAAVKKDGKVGYIDKNNITRINYLYDNLSFISEGLINVKLGNKWGYIDIDGNVVIDFKYDEAYPFFNDMAYVGINNKYGYINKENKIIIDIALDFTGDYYYENYGLLDLAMNYIVIKDTYGNYRNSHLFIKANRIKDNLILFIQDDKFGYMNIKGYITIPPIYDYATSFINEKAIVRIDNKSLIIDTEGNILKSFFLPYSLGDIRENLIRFYNSDTNKAGIMNINGEIISENKYDKIMPVDNDYMNVVLNNKWGIIDKHGNEVISTDYNYISPVTIEGIVTVRKYK